MKKEHPIQADGTRLQGSVDLFCAGLARQTVALRKGSRMKLKLREKGEYFMRNHPWRAISGSKGSCEKNQRAKVPGFL